MTSKNNFYKASIAIIICIIVITMALILGKGSTSIYYDKISNSLFKTYSEKEVNYLFFQYGDIKIVDIFFPENIQEYDFQDSELYFQNNLVKGEYYVQEVKGNHVLLWIHDYLPEFDSISVKYKNKELFLYTGKYFFELNNNLQNEKYNYIKDNHSEIEGLKYLSEFKLNTKYNGNVLVKIPSKALDNSLIKKSEITSSNNDVYKYILEINNIMAERYTLERISIDTIFLLQSQQKEQLKTQILQSNIPFQVEGY